MTDIKDKLLADQAEHIKALTAIIEQLIAANKTTYIYQPAQLQPSPSIFPGVFPNGPYCGTVTAVTPHNGSVPVAGP